MTKDKLDSIIELKEKIDQLERVLQIDEIFYVGNINQSSNDYYRTYKGSCLHEGIYSLLKKELEVLKKQFENY